MSDVVINISDTTQATAEPSVKQNIPSPKSISSSLTPRLPRTANKYEPVVTLTFNKERVDD